MAGMSTLRQYAELGPLHRGTTLSGGWGATDFMVYEPRGLLAVVTPWNDPVAVSCGLIGAALVTGNAVVFKPSERTPATGWLLADLIRPLVPDGVFTSLAGGAHMQRGWRDLPVGTVKINNVFGGAPGGAAHPRRCSGQGYGYGPELLDEFTAAKVVHIEPPRTEGAQPTGG
jgi:acyl-CoA reductase-like NAD-dependent aldehyde dehydrogenase